VVELSERLKLAVTEAEDINLQEKLFGWAASKYGMVSKMTGALEPHRTLWTTVNAFYDSYALWMNGPFMNLNPEEVDAETADAFRLAGTRQCLHVQLG
jgi:dynein heavy chain, axonemal